MKRSPVIGIVTGLIEPARHMETAVDQQGKLSVNGQNTTYSDAVEEAGGTAIFLPISATEERTRRKFEVVDGILLAGGNDINVALYSDEEPHPKHEKYDDVRDRMEGWLIDWCLSEQVPILGICRGMQRMNARFGGTLFQDLPDQNPTEIDHSLSTKQDDITYIAHPIDIKESSKLAYLLGAHEAPVNSHHHQAIQRLADRLIDVAWAPDRIIEAVELRDKRHPFFMGERLCVAKAFRGFC
jgi:putative glutamine amidotransferase